MSANGAGALLISRGTIRDFENEELRAREVADADSSWFVT
jgi:hypothetical protein